MSKHARRKEEHLDLCATSAVSFRGATTLLEGIHLVHDSLPELAAEEIDLSTEILGKRLRAPLMISGMTGGVPRAEALNRDLASVAQELGIGFGFGSMRPLLEEGNALGYHVREVAPDALVLANIGVVQARASSPEQLAEMVRSTGCDALAIHLNPAQELIQQGGDRDFRGGVDTIAQLVDALPCPVLVKETGLGYRAVWANA
jgi:isopentenyl-diphosphate delta-isomerase